MQGDGTGTGAFYFPEGHKLEGSFHDPQDPDGGGDTSFDKPAAVAAYQPAPEKSRRLCRDSMDLPDVRKFLGQTHFEKQHAPQGIARNIRKVWFPELFREKFSVDLIRTRYLEAPPPTGMERAMQDVIPYQNDVLNEPGRWSDTPPKFVLCLHPSFPGYWGLFEYVRGSKDSAGAGPGYKCFSVAQEEPVDGQLPPGLNEKRWSHLRGKIGTRRPFLRKDFELLRYCADRHLGVDTVDERLSEGDVAHEKAVDALHADVLDDFHDYYFRAIQQAANDGQKQWCHVTNCQDIVKQNNESKFYTEQREGYTVRARRGSHFETELRKERELQIHAVTNERSTDEQIRERARAATLQQQAKAIQLGQQLIKRRKQL